MTIQAQLFNLVVMIVISGAALSHYRKARYAETNRYSTFWPRFLSRFVDALVLWPLSAFWIVMLRYGIAPTITIPTGLIVTFAGWIYIVWLHARYGATVGKMVCRVRIVDARTEMAIGWRQALIREALPIASCLGSTVWLFTMMGSGRLQLNGTPGDGRILFQSQPFWLFSMIPVLWFFAEVITMLTNQKRRAVHDWIAGTVVVRTNVESMTVPAGLTSSGDAPGEATK